jgi:hypothetical protein
MPANTMNYKRRPDVRTRQLNGEMLVLDDSNGCIHQLNPTASFVWEHCDGNNSKAEIVRRLLEQFDADKVVADRDVSDILEKFVDLKLLCQ